MAAFWRRFVYSSGVANIVVLTQAAYDALTPKQDNTLYLIQE